MPKPAAHSLAPSGSTKSRRTALCVLGVALLWLYGSVQPSAWADSASGAEFVIIVHPTNALTSIERTLLADALLKRTSRWQDGETIRPVDLPADSAVRRAFSESVLKRSVSAVRSYWLQRVFSGRELPPPELESEEAAVRFVESTPGALGYVSPRAKLTRAKVVSVR